MTGWNSGVRELREQGQILPRKILTQLAVQGVMINPWPHTIPVLDLGFLFEESFILQKKQL